MSEKLLVDRDLMERLFKIIAGDGFHEELEIDQLLSATPTIKAGQGEAVAWANPADLDAIKRPSTVRYMIGSKSGSANVPLYVGPPIAVEVGHSDDAAIDRFGKAMKDKMASARAKGRSGWDDPALCQVETLAEMLVSHLRKGNPGTFEDVANFAMMLHQRAADPKALEAVATKPSIELSIVAAITSPPATGVIVPTEWRDMLEELQWQWEAANDHDHVPSGHYCPSCRNPKTTGHADHCEIAALLAQSQEVKS